VPILTLRLNKLPPAKVKYELAENLSLITEKILRKNRKLIVVRFDVDTQQDQWFSNGFVTQQDMIFELNILITKGTNTELEKNQWIAESWKITTNAVGNSSHPNYISIREIDGGDWGYNGLTQNQRKNNPPKEDKK
jgi:4-oxalocrotonate tautomerase